MFVYTDKDLFTRVWSRLFDALIAQEIDFIDKSSDYAA